MTVVGYVRVSAEEQEDEAASMKSKFLAMNAYREIYRPDRPHRPTT